MIFWGYSIPEGKTIDYDKNDKEFAEFLFKKAPDSALCIGCGSCTATCTAGNLTDFNIRKLQILIKRGEYEETRKNIHSCMLCGKCLLVCPRGVNTRKMILAIMEYIRQ
ncbi:MAG: 4Fe-4S dicluster domain-containing protein [Odoribacter sp.]|nr:4Fe-4S dicluster domain-containing protein [Odoribacter sp.]